MEAAEAAARLVMRGAKVDDVTKAIGVAKVYDEKKIQEIHAGTGPEGDALARQLDIEIDLDSAENALDYIRKSLDLGLPVVIGVNVAKDKQFYGNYGGVTDHFLVLHGYESNDEGEVVRLFGSDNAAIGTAEVEFEVESDTKKS